MPYGAGLREEGPQGKPFPLLALLPEALLVVHGDDLVLRPLLPHRLVRLECLLHAECPHLEGEQWRVNSEQRTVESEQ